MADEKDGKTVPIQWFVPDDLQTNYATNVVIQHTEHEFVIMFFEVEPPLLVGSKEEKEKTLQSIESVRAKCVSRIVLAPGKMEEVIRAFTDNLERYRATSKKKEHN